MTSKGLQFWEVLFPFGFALGCATEGLSGVNPTENLVFKSEVRTAGSSCDLVVRASKQYTKGKLVHLNKVSST